MMVLFPGHYYIYYYIVSRSVDVAISLHIQSYQENMPVFLVSESEIFVQQLCLVHLI